MRRYVKIMMVLMAVLTTLSIGSAQVSEEADVDTVILASTENYPDGLVASAVSQRKGIPVVLTERYNLSDEALSSIEEYSPSKIVIVGGSSVVSQDIEEYLSESYDVDRVWGVTRYGTAVEFSDYFWPAGTDEAVLVENGEEDIRGDILAQARAVSDGRPVFLTPSGKLPVSVVMQLEDMGVENVTYVGRTVSQEFRDQLKGIDVSLNSSFSGESEEDIRDNLDESLMNRFNRSKPFIVVAASDFRQSLATVNNPNSNSYVVGNMSDVEDLKDFIEEMNLSEIRIVGAPGFSERIASELDSEMELNISLRGLSPADAGRFASENARENREEFRNRRRRAMDDSSDDSRRTENLGRRANHTIERADDVLRKYNASDSTVKELERSRELFESGNFSEALRTAESAMSSARMKNWESISSNVSRVREAAEDETSDMREEIQELSEMNREFSERMSENISSEERLEIIRELRDERREQVREIVEEAGSREPNGGIGQKIREVRKERERFRESDEEDESDDENESDDDEAEDRNIETDMECRESEVEEFVEMEYEDGRIDVEGQVMLNDLGYTPSVSFDSFDETDGKYVRINFEERQDVMGATCLGYSEFETGFEIEDGNWTVTSEVFVGSEKVLESTKDFSISSSSMSEDSRPSNGSGR